MSERRRRAEGNKEMYLFCRSTLGRVEPDSVI